MTQKINLDQGLELLQKNYLKKITLHITELRRLKEILIKGFLPTKDIQQLYRTTHNFAGSGTTFGFPEISSSARDLHETLKLLLDAGGSGKLLQKQTAELRVKLEAFELACKNATYNKNSSKPHYADPLPESLAANDTKNIGVFSRPTESSAEVAAQLKHFGYNVFLSEDASAFQNAKIHDVVIIYSDLQTRDSAFIELVSKYHPVILISSKDNFESRLAGVRAGVQSYLTDSADVIKIIDKIEQIYSENAPPPAWNIMIVDDDDMLADFYAHTLQSTGMKTSVLSSPKECLQALADQAVDLILIDFSMPHCNGKELATIIRQHQQYVSLPIVFMSAQQDIEALLINEGLGIDDFLVKPFTPEQLVSVVSSRAKRAAELKSFMVRDSFTGLLNHAYFLEILSAELMDVKRHSRKTCYAMIDIDHFKKINDTYGHAAGDQVIKSLSHMLQQQLRRSDILGRCGGEEFGIIMPGCDLENAQRIMESLRVKFSEGSYSIGKNKINVTFSGGVTALDADTTIDQLINSVDEALYKAKEGGRNKVITA